MNCFGQEILLVGNPNTGKTTLFNSITKSNEHVGNWHGVTVEDKSKDFEHSGKLFSLVDLPGIYSLHALSFEEQVAIDYILSHKDKKIVNICDVNNLERNLFLTLCLLENGLDVVLAVNNTLKKPICKIDVKKLSNCLGIDVVLVNASTREGIDVLLDKACQKPLKKEAKKFDSNFILDGEERYSKIEKIMNECVVKTKDVYGKSKLDQILLNRFFAPIIFFAIMAVIFYLTFFLLGSFFSNLLLSLWQMSFGWLLNYIFASAVGSSSWVAVMVDEAIVGGFGMVLSFLPQIVLLYFFLSILEDSGYLSRVAFVFDDMLEKIGLSGKSIYTLLMGFGCSASAIMTARTMDDKNAKIKTVMVAPYLSCSARLPIYLAIGGAFFGAKNIFLILLLYVIGIIISVFLAYFLNKSLLKSKKQTFLLEFPAYRLPSMKRALKILWDNIKTFILRIGSLLISMNVIVWVLSNFSFSLGFIKNSDGESMLQTIAKFISPIFAPIGFSSWGLVVSLLVGVVAKEGVLASMTLLAGGDLIQGLFSQSSVIYFSSAAGVVSFLTFCLLYIPCLSTIAVMKKEIGGKWTFISIALEFVIAYFVSMIMFNLSKLCQIFGLGKIILFAIIVLILLFSIIRLFNFAKSKNKCKGCGFCRK